VVLGIRYLLDLIQPVIFKGGDVGKRVCYGQQIAGCVIGEGSDGCVRFGYRGQVVV